MRHTISSILCKAVFICWIREEIIFMHLILYFFYAILKVSITIDSLDSRGNTWMWITKCAQARSQNKTDKNATEKIEINKKNANEPNPVMNLYAQTCCCCCCDDDCLFISSVVSFWFLSSTDGTDWLLLFAFCWLFIVYNLIRRQIGGSSNWSILLLMLLSSSSPLSRFSLFSFNNIYNSICLIPALRWLLTDYWFSSIWICRRSNCRVLLCLCDWECVHNAFDITCK